MMSNGHVLRSSRGSFLFTVPHCMLQGRKASSIILILLHCLFNLTPHVQVHTIPCHAMSYHAIPPYTTYAHHIQPLSPFVSPFLSCVLGSVQCCILTTSSSFIATLYIQYVHLTCSSELMMWAIYYGKKKLSRFYVPSFCPIQDETIL